MRRVMRWLSEELNWLPIIVGGVMFGILAYAIFGDLPTDRTRRAREACLAEGYTRFEYTSDHVYCIKSVDGTDVVKAVKWR
jgi:hypothetical protein